VDLLFIVDQLDDSVCTMIVIVYLYTYIHA